jgi:WS/DGAT/MGAT family acyltransferase
VPPPRELLRAELQHRFRGALGFLGAAARGLAAPVRSAQSLVGVIEGLAEGVATAIRPASPTPLAVDIGPHRRFDWTAMDLADVKAVKNRLGGSLNDVVLATVAGAVREFLERRRVSVEGLEFRVMSPVSVRTQSERGTLGNRVSAWIVDLPIAERDPRRCVERIAAETSRLKSSKQAVGADLLTQAVAWTPSTLLSLGSRMALRALPFNLVVTNVPGPQVPLYLLGSRMVDNFPQVPLTDYLGLGIALFSYAGQLFWGINADWDLVPEVHEVVEAILASFAELRDAAMASAAGDAQRAELPRR